MKHNLGRKPWSELKSSIALNWGCFDVGAMNWSKESQLEESLSQNDVWAMFSKIISQREGWFRFMLDTHQQMLTYFLKYFRDSLESVQLLSQKL